MILAAGEGTRLRPLTLETPKALLPVGGIPLVEWQIAWLSSHGISWVAINLCHLGERIKQHLGDGSGYGVEIVYSTEAELLGTAGGIKKMEAFFADSFVVLYGDVLTDFDLSDMMACHRTAKAVATLALVKTVNPEEVGIVETDTEDRILSFTEKSSKLSDTGKLANGGVYILEKDIFRHISPKGSSDFAYDVFPVLIDERLPLYGYILKQGDYLQDIGSPERYRRALEDVKTGRVGRT